MFSQILSIFRPLFDVSRRQLRASGPKTALPFLEAFTKIVTDFIAQREFFLDDLAGIEAKAVRARREAVLKFTVLVLACVELVALAVVFEMDVASDVLSHGVISNV
jgi:hypothetical protein